MSDQMKPVPFSELLRQTLMEYKREGAFFGVPVRLNEKHIPVGPAAGPHTQLAANIVASYAAGAEYIECKTVQILEGDALQLEKPCIYPGHEIFNTEWSTELTVEEARDEYIKAYLLIAVLSKEFQLTEVEKISFICSVGYDMEGIRSSKINAFLNDMKAAGNTLEWQKDILYLKEHMQFFSTIQMQDIQKIEKSDCISDTVMLSTMHGCKKDEIVKIATYLIQSKGFHTYIKMNPTLIGKEAVKHTLTKKGYDKLQFPDEIFSQDIDLEMAVEIIRTCQKVARQYKKIFGIKMTNTFPINITQDELPGTQMYLSGPALYPLAIQATAMLQNKMGEDIPISYSGGADFNNIVALLETGMCPITVSSLLLKPGGYKKLTRLILKAEGYQKKDIVDEKRLSQLAREALEDKNYDYARTPVFETKQEYGVFCAKCGNCVDVCPNRANIRIKREDVSYVIHRDRLCNECGSCKMHCVMGHSPYQEKFTIYESIKDFRTSGNDGALLDGDEIIRCRYKGLEGFVPELIKKIIETGKEEGKI